MTTFELLELKHLLNKLKKHAPILRDQNKAVEGCLIVVNTLIKKPKETNLKNIDEITT